MQFYLSCFRIVVKPKEKLFLPAYKGAVLRGGFGWAFKNLVCIQKERHCSGCLISGRCSYFQLFETPVPENAKMMRKYPFAPHPFILTPPLDAKREYDNSCELEFGLTLVGRAAGYLPYFVCVFDELGRRGLGGPNNQFSLVRVEDASGVDGNPLVYDGESRKLSDNFRRLEFAMLQETGLNGSQLSDSPAIVLKLLTPMHLVHEGRVDHDIKFTTVMEALLRRIKLLQYFHCLDHHDDASLENISSADKNSGSRNGSGELSLDEIHQLLSISDQVETIERRVRWTGQSRKSGHSGAPMTLSGFSGEIEYRFPSQEALATLAPYLRLGEFIHIGKNTSFGFGKIKLDKFTERK